MNNYYLINVTRLDTKTLSERIDIELWEDAKPEYTYTSSKLIKSEGFVVRAATHQALATKVFNTIEANCNSAYPQYVRGDWSI